MNNQTDDTSLDESQNNSLIRGFESRNNPYQDGVINLTKGTFKKPYTGATLAKELDDIGFNVSIIQGAKSPNPETVMAKLTLK